jgi:tyrosine-specific transport protein
VVKAGEILQQITGVPYAPGCLLASVIVGGFTLRAPPRVVETANTALTAALTLGFLALIVSTLAAAFFGTSAVGPALATAGARLRFADWSLLLPGQRVTWAAPIFLNLLCFGQAIPLVVERMAAQAKASAGLAPPTPPRPAERVAAMRRTRRAVLIGSAIPLVLSMLWIVVTSSVLPPAADPTKDPVLALIASAPPIAIPVTVMASGAIGTTLIASYLTIGQFIADFLCLVTGYCSPRDQLVARIISVALPVAVACGGPALYLPLLSFAGAFPTTFLYGLLPPLAALVLRRAANRDAQDGSASAPPLVRWLPGGRAPLVGAGLVAIALLLTNSAAIVAPVLAAVRAALR